MRLLVTVMLTLLSFSYTAVAQEEEEGRDYVEVAFFGGVSIPGGGLTDWESAGAERAAKTGFDVGIEGGYFVRQNLLVGLNFVYTQFSIDAAEQSDHKHRLYNPNLYVKYLFEGESNFVPYFKLEAGVDNPKFSTFVINQAANRFREISYDPAIAIGLGAGLFYYTADFSGIFLEANFHQAFSKDVKARYIDTDYVFGKDLGKFDIRAGVRVLFGS
ncbi:MAG TPA: hypothetical protein VN285_08400 [Candidatus Deferrimicrobium sp.]|nr:hypothetical protein [Candidatus Deferrimicrobium sp.]